MAYFWAYTVIEEKKDQTMVERVPATDTRPAGDAFSVHVCGSHLLVHAYYTLGTSFFRFRALVAYAALWCAIFKVPLLHSSLSLYAMMCRGTVEGISIFEMP
jgi:hypothetical protein